MHWSILTTHLMALLIIACSNEINGESRPKRDLQLITNLLRAKLDGLKSFSEVVNARLLPPVVIKKPNVLPEIQTYAQTGFKEILQPIKVTVERPCDTKPTQTVTQEPKPVPYTGNYYYKQIRDDGTSMIYKSNENGEVDVIDTRYTVPEEELKPMPYKTKYLYTQFQNEGDSSGVIYTLGNRGQVQVSNIKNVPLNTGNNVLQRSSVPYEAGTRPIWTPRHINNFANPISSMQVPVIQNNVFTPEYSYKLLHRDGSVTTWLGTGDIKGQQLKFPPGANYQKAIPDPPSYLVNRIENVAANTLCLEKPTNMLCRLNPVHATPNVQVGVFPLPVAYDNAYIPKYATMAPEVPFSQQYIYVPPSSDLTPKPVTASTEKSTQIYIDDVKVNDDVTQASTVAPLATESSFSYKQLNADGSAMTVKGKGTEGVSVELNDGESRFYKSGRGDIPEGRSP